MASDPRGLLWLTSCDVRSRPIAVTDPLGQATITGYDAAGNVLAVTQADGTVTANTYDALNRLITTTNLNGETTALFYGGLAYGDGTKGDKLVRFTDGKGQATRLDYDLRGQRVRKTHADGSHADWTYDALGRLATAVTVARQTDSCDQAS